MLTAVQGVVYLYNNGATVSTTDFSMADWLDKTIVPLFANRAIIAISLVLLFQFILKRTSFGRGYYLVGGNIQTAWLAGLRTDRYLISAFIFSGFAAALGGSIFACSLAAAMANIGERGVNPLMIIIAATVLGGTSLSGGSGSVLKSFFGVLTLTVLFNALTCFKAGYEMQIFISGLVLMLVIFLEAYSTYKKNLTKGQKRELL
jgi:ribose transport system permease protein